MREKHAVGKIIVVALIVIAVIASSAITYILTRHGEPAPLKYFLAIAIVPVSSGMTDPQPGITQQDGGTWVHLNASAYEGYAFSCWVVDEINQTGALLDIYMNCNHTIVACFAPLTVAVKAQVQIDTMDLVTSTEGGVVFTSTIKNGGNKPALNVTVQLYNETDVYYYDAAPLQPGQTVAFTEAPAEEYIIGNAYLVTVTAEYTDGSTSSIVASVTCRG